MTRRITQDRWRELTRWPLAAASVIFLAAYAVEVLADLHGAAARPLNLVINITWAMFIVDYLVMLVLAERRWRWFSRHLPALAIIALPVFRPLRLLRLVTLIGFLHRATGSAVRGRVAVYVLISTALLVFVASLAVLDAERHADGATIGTFGDALWWSWVTITTVGYGDFYPVTLTGRFVGVLLMLGGIALIGVVTATFASYIVDLVGRRSDDTQAATRRQVSELSDEIRSLRSQLEDRDASGS